MGSGANFLGDFMDDFYAECQEHLSAIRRSLISLENDWKNKRPISGSLEELFRRFHTIKGLSAMAGIEKAEFLAHELESALRNLKDGSVILREDEIPSLEKATNLLTEILTRSKKGEPIPDYIEEAKKILSTFHKEKDVKETPPLPLKEEEEEILLQLKPQERGKLEEFLKKGWGAWILEFSPTPSLMEKGINVNKIRETLGKIGELVASLPSVKERGEISFEFLFLSPKEENLKALPPTGIKLKPFRVPTKPIEGPPQVEEKEKPSPPVTPSSLVRVDLKKLEEVLYQVGELVITKNRLSDLLKSFEDIIPLQAKEPLSEVNAIFERHLRDLRAGIMRIRLVQIGEVFERMHFACRDLSRDLKKEVEIEVSGQETELDKLVIEKITDPLLHMVRNALAHGIETPEERKILGKNPRGKITLRAYTEGESVILEVGDDGKGIDLEKVAEKAREMGIIQEGENLDPGKTLEILSSPGFSTKEGADLQAGRGMGMSVVVNAVRELGGEIRLETKPNEGSLFRLKIPLTLAIFEALLVEEKGSLFAISRQRVKELREVREEEIKDLEKGEMIPHRGKVIPVVRLSEALGGPWNEQKEKFALIIPYDSGEVALLVQKLAGIREIVARPISITIPGIYGATELGDGRLILILDLKDLIDWALKKKKRSKEAEDDGK